MTDIQPIQFDGEVKSNSVRAKILQQEPFAIRTFTPSQCVISHSAGSYHYTPEGRKLADFTSGVLVANLGHNPVAWWNRVVGYLGLEAIKEGGEYANSVPLTAYNAITEIESQANERLIANLQAAPGGNRINQIMWSASGSEAVQKALWAAIKYQPGKDMIIATRNGFHGKKGLAGAVTGSEKDKERDERVRFISFPKTECDDVETRKQPIDLKPYQQELDTLWEKHGDRLCCVITEPYLGGGGSYHPQKEYLQLLQAFCREHNLVFILDEIQSNFGRTGPMYAFSHYEIEPDIVLLGKGLGNGVPVSAAVGRNDVWAMVRPPIRGVPTRFRVRRSLLPSTNSKRLVHFARVPILQALSKPDSFGLRRPGRSVKSGGKAVSGVSSVLTSENAKVLLSPIRLLRNVTWVKMVPWLSTCLVR